MTKTIGIDLGTTYSVVAHVSEDGDVTVLPNDLGELLTPSAVYFDDQGRVTVGGEAKAFAAAVPDRVVTGIKRHMGREHSLMFGEHTYRPEGISAFILKRLAADAAAELGVNVDQLAAVITVPAYFGVAEREATAAAAQIAGLKCLDLVAEPVAAALSYGVGSGEVGTVLVYDLGGGTFDATIVKLGPDGPDVVAVDGSVQLGGLDFDDRLLQLILDRYVAATSDGAALDDEDFVLRVGQQTEDFKISLSRAVTGSATIHRDGASAKVAVTRNEFEHATNDLMVETLEVVDRVIATGVSLGALRPSMVILVGGATRMPMVSSRLEAHLGVPARLRDPDQAVAKGAAIHGYAMLPEQVKGRIAPSSNGTKTGIGRLAASKPVRSVVPRALGVKLIDSHDPTGERIFVDHLIKANTKLPVVGVSATFSTILDGQDKVRVELMEQAGAVASEEVEFNRRVLDGELQGIPGNLQAGSPIKITISIGIDGRITCVAEEPESGKSLTLVSYMDGVSDGAEVQSQQTALGALKFRS